MQGQRSVAPSTEELGLDAGPGPAPVGSMISNGKNRGWFIPSGCYFVAFLSTLDSVSLATYAVCVVAQQTPFTFKSAWMVSLFSFFLFSSLFACSVLYGSDLPFSAVEVQRPPFATHWLARLCVRSLKYCSKLPDRRMAFLAVV
jgi:hypothetical protein